MARDLPDASAVFVRVNSGDTEWFEEDLKLCAVIRVRGVAHGARRPITGWLAALDVSASPAELREARAEASAKLSAAVARKVKSAKRRRR